MKQIFFFLTILFFSAFVKAQNVDSLKTLVSNFSGKEKGLAFEEIGKAFQTKQNFDSAIFYYKSAIQYLNINEKKTEIFHEIGMIYFYKNNFSKTLENFKSSLYFAMELSNDSLIATRYSDIGVVYDYLGVFDKSADFYYKAINVFEKRNDKIGLSKTYNNLGIITQSRGKYDDAIKLYEKSLILKKEANDLDKNIATSFVNLGSVYEAKKEYNKALKYYRKAYSIYKKDNLEKNLALTLSNIAGVNFLLHEIDSASFYTEKSLKINKVIKNKLGLIGNYRLKGNVLLEKNKIDSSIVFFNNALLLADTLKVLSDQFNILVDLVKANKQKKDFRKAFTFQEALLVIKDSLNNEKSNNKIETLKIIYETDKKEAEILLLQKNAKIKAKRNLIITAIAIFILLLGGVIAFLIFRQKLTKTKHKADLFNQKLLRLQMNPHFIFNSLASIQSYMLEKDTKKAAFYLSSFSKLTRAILNNSRQEFITLQEDVDTIENYLKIQQMRFENNFNYNIIIDEKIDPDNVKVAPMLLQPFVENAVIHGFKDIDYKGSLNIEYKKGSNNIQVIIEDNGKGIEKTENKTHKSHAIDITKERLEILNIKKKNKITFKLTPSKEKGVKIIFSIPYIKTINKINV